jgi:hypothetical protein
MNCPKCKNPMAVNIHFTGGCQGHGPDEYCYCNEPDIYIDWACHHWSKRGKLCRQKSISIPALSDQYSILRWIQERL